MVGRTVFGFCAVALIAGCKQQQDTNQANAVVPSAETRAAAPLSKDQALALMKQREGNMKTFGKASKTIHKALDSSAPDIAAIQQSAAKTAELAPKLLSWFPAGTGPETGKTRAKAEIWRKPEDFALKAHDFEKAAAEFDVAARTGDLGQIRPSYAALGKSCKACHDLYRAPEEKH